MHMFVKHSLNSKRGGQEGTIEGLPEVPPALVLDGLQLTMAMMLELEEDPQWATQASNYDTSEGRPMVQRTIAMNIYLTVVFFTKKIHVCIYVLRLVFLLRKDRIQYQWGFLPR